MIPLRDDNPSEPRPVVTTTLIALCVVTFLWQILHGRQGQALLGYSFGLVPSHARVFVFKKRDVRLFHQRAS